MTTDNTSFRVYIPIHVRCVASRPTGRYETLIAVNGQTALELLRKYPDRVSFVLLDIIMPVMNGIELLQVLKVRVRVDPPSGVVVFD